ncbi:UvrD-helicase domain-containing protein [Burkholderia sp. Bp8991]|uniref:UvrD-helicase domain-containing protein n=1 Tax=Burkholderia sp. Bp8991 TaxID=2184553 RepID=UPI000F5AEDC5|nr:ATP-dependent helicase [Burkholderia sp. Bp8991]RQR98584.1 ATP-dependent helicase [Burkholderia sp. Bp8991]
MFAWTTSELNAEQAEAVREAGSVFLIACPGSGKTRTLTYKIAYELSRLQSERQFVIAITYTHRAADEIQQRIEDLGVDTARLWIGTIHAFCLEWIIKPYGIYEPALAHGYRIIDQHEKELLLEQLCQPYARERITFFDCEYYFAHDGYHLGCPNPAKHLSLHAILAEYFRTLEANRQIDFELLLWHACKLVERIPDISRLLSQVFSIVLVDEYQDTKEIQYAIIASILRSGAGATRLFMVGDPNQAIYGSLGGYPIDLADLRALTNLAITPKHLSFNYRSSSRIIEYFGNFNVYNTQIVPGGEDQDYPSLISYNTQVAREDLIEEIARLVRHNIENLGIPPQELCVLAPQWVHLATITRGLAAALPQYQFDGPGMVPFARDTENFWYKLSRIALTEPSPGMYSRRLRWAEEVLRDLRHVGVDTSNLSAKTFLRESNAIDVQEHAGLEYLRRYFDEIFQRLQVQYREIGQLRDHHAAFFESSARRIARLQNDGVAGIADLEFFRRVFQNREGITVSTIHGVKGAEFDVVLAFALLEGMVPHFNDQNGPQSARKLLYVIGSRARKNLHLFSERGRPRGRNNVYLPTRSLAACVFNYDVV